jgi:uncharacterized membrane protein (DUF4010 family)
VAVILIAGIGFVNYVLWKMYGTRGTELAGFLGGLVNSNFTVIELSSRAKEAYGSVVDSIYRGILLSTTAMVVRNAALLLILAPLALADSLMAFVLMLATSGGLALWTLRRRERNVHEEPPSLKLELPFSLPLALKYGFVFLVLHVVGELAQRHFGELGFYFVSVVGGFMSSASAVAAAATLASRGTLPPNEAGIGAVLASLTSIAFSLSFVLRTRNRPLIRRLAWSMVCVTAAGGLGMMVWGPVHPVVQRWILMIGEAF